MENLVKLSARQQKVLRATVRHYVATAEPVGSKALVNSYNLKVSPATIRNVMGVLERSGLLYQPHTSAGRVPSDSGYRIYVDELVQPSKPIARQIDQVLTHRLDWEGCSLEALLREAAQVLARLSGYIALVTLPTAESAKLRHLQLVRVDENQILLVVLLDSYRTESVIIQFPQIAETASSSRAALDRELQILSNFLTEQLRDQPLSAIAALSWSELDQVFQQYIETLQTAIQALAQRQQGTQAQILISGLADALSQPEFSERQQIQNLVSLLEDGKEQLWPLIFQSDNSARLQVWIGSENPIEPMQTCALISSVYTKNSAPLGSVGILGPTRMLYENAIAAVEAAADYLSGAITQAA
ncbi:MAG: heat-inducible transcriptional repressor HrcA [Leptolyngbya sp. SIO4C1]|nr:heat-inducible transcriptional repressor HrcA [Leptolyngbya sp. SIO4C1]